FPPQFDVPSQMHAVEPPPCEDPRGAAGCSPPATAPAPGPAPAPAPPAGESVPAPLPCRSSPSASSVHEESTRLARVFRRDQPQPRRPSLCLGRRVGPRRQRFGQRRHGGRQRPLDAVGHHQERPVPLLDPVPWSGDGRRLPAPLRGESNCLHKNSEKCVENELTREDSRVELIYFTDLSRSPVLTDLPVSKDRAGWMGVG